MYYVGPSRTEEYTICHLFHFSISERSGHFGIAMFGLYVLAKRIAIYVHILGLMTQHSLTVSLNILPVTGAFEKRSWWKTTDTVDLICKSNSSTKQLGRFL